MSTLALMRWLEAAPDRYDRGMRWLTLGRADRIRAALARAAAPAPGGSVLEIGCGTGALTRLLADAGARVTAVEQNPAMLEIARERLASSQSCTWMERTAAEIDRLPAGAFDAVVASFALSEMSTDERRFVLRHARERLAAGGRLAIADEVRPRARLTRLLFAMLRAPQAALGWLLVGSVSHPVTSLSEEIAQAGFRITHERRWLGGHLALVVAEPRAGSA